MKKLIGLLIGITALFGLNSCFAEYDTVDDIIVKPTVTIRPYYRYYDYYVPYYSRPYYNIPYYYRHHRYHRR